MSVRVGLNTTMHAHGLEIAREYSGREDLELIDMGGRLQILACKDEFASFEDAYHVIEGVRQAITGYIPGPLTIYVKENNLDEFVSVAKYAIRLEQELRKARRAFGGG